ncbi:MAG: gamma-glutamyltransferase, partial [Acidimicrobiia bacterium]
MHGYGAAVVTPHVFATQAAMALIASGANAVDAAIAANATLGVVAPETCGIGGDLFALVHRPGVDRPETLNASGRSGTGADPDRLRAAGHLTMPPFHPQAVTVPGCVDGWEALLARHGSRDLDEILAPAIRLANEGFPASAELSLALTRRSELRNETASVGLYPDGNPPYPGDRLGRPGLAATLSAIANGGREAFYLGPSGENIIEATGGVITGEDLEQVQSEWVEPISAVAFGLTGWVVPPNSQGYLTIASC